MSNIATITPPEFKEFPKMGRFSRDCIITEKIDGTNGQICITPEGQFFVGSRNRWITPEEDNFGFAKWAYEHETELRKLGVGRHYGEWWGNGIQRGYGLKEKRFSLFNVVRWCLPGETPKRIPMADPRIEKYQEVLPSCVGLVPKLTQVSFDGINKVVDACLETLADVGSFAAPGFQNPEGIVIFHVASGVGFKKTIKDDGVPKSLINK